MKYEEEIKKHFEEFFRELIKDGKITIMDKKIKIIELKKFDDLKQLSSNPGFYVILTDYELSNNTCKCIYKCNNKVVKAVYRGEANNRKERITGHLFNDEYSGEDTKFMTINDDNGININKEPYCNYIWYVLMCSMNESNQQIRRCVERAFDSVFEKPMYSSR